MIFKSKYLSLSLAQDETVVEWVLSVIFIILVIIAVLFIGPADPPGYTNPSDQNKVEVTNER